MYKYSVLFFIFLLSGCELIEYSPYDADVSIHNLNEKNINKIKSVPQNDTLCFVAIADVHDSYNELYEAVKKINQLSNVSFVVVCGDITDTGLSQEFEWYYNVMRKLKCPYITIIGNHDYRSNGDAIYKKMFGPVNFSFNVGLHHFVAFDDVVWENSNTSPDFDWLEKTLQYRSYSSVILSHIPPYTDQLLCNDNGTKMMRILDGSNANLSIHGHLHNYSYFKKNDVNYLVAGSVGKETLNYICLHDSAIIIKRIEY